MRVSSGDLIRKFSQFCDVALRDPVIVTKNGRDRLVLLSIDEYNHLRDLLEKVDHNELKFEQPRKVSGGKSGD